MTPEETRAYIGRLLRQEYETLRAQIKALQAQGADTERLERLAIKMFRAVQEAERGGDGQAS